MGLSLKDFKAKQFFLEKGERVALGLAAFIAGLMLIVSLFVPPNGLMSPSHAEVAKTLKSATTSVQQQLSSSAPGPNDKPGEAKLVGFAFERIDGSPYRIGGWWTSEKGSLQQRGLPELLAINEGAAQIAWIHVDGFVFSKRMDAVMALKTQDKNVGVSGARPGLNNLNARLTAGNPMSGRPGGGMRGTPMMGPGGVQNPTSFGNIPQENKKNSYDPVFVPLTELKENSMPLARQIYPVAMTIIAASFPYKAQLKEIQEKLGLDSLQAVLDRTTGSATKDKSKAPPAVRFLRVDVQRRLVDADGKPIPGNDWEEIPDAYGRPSPEAIRDNYRRWTVIVGNQFEKDDPELAPLQVPGLVWKRLKVFRPERSGDAPGTAGPAGFRAGYRPGYTFGNLPMSGQGPKRLPPGAPGTPPTRPMNPTGGTSDKDKDNGPVEGKYPNIEKDLASIQNALKAFQAKEDGPQPAAIPAQFQGADNFDNAAPQEGNNQPGGNRPPVANPNRPNPGMPPGGPGGKQAQQAVIPDSVLIRLIDVAIEPGKNYQYRLRVHMSNPLEGRIKEVADPNLASATELNPEGKWYVIPQTVRVPDDLFYYLVNERDLAVLKNKPYKGPYAWGFQDLIRDTSKYAIFQAHRWVRSIQLKEDEDPHWVGEWVIAERYWVERGEYVGRKERAQVPLWLPTSDSYVLAGEAGKQNQKNHWWENPGIPVMFGHERQDRPEALLVDFEGGDQDSYERIEGGRVVDPLNPMELPKPNKPVTDTMGQEALILTPEGRLVAHHSARDSQDAERRERLEKYRDRIKSLKEDKKNTSGSGDPFGK